MSNKKKKRIRIAKFVAHRCQNGFLKPYPSSLCYSYLCHCNPSSIEFDSRAEFNKQHKSELEQLK